MESYMETQGMTKILTTALALSALVFVGCNDDHPVASNDKVPTTPQGIYTVTGDHNVLVYWNGIYERDVNHYRVYRSLQATTGYVAITNVAAEDNPNLDLIIYDYQDNGPANGVMYWYAVSAVDNAGQESPLSAEDAFDTPRPEGTGNMIPNDIAPALAGFNLATHQNIDWNSAAADVWVDRVIDIIGVDTTIYSYINAGDTVDIQDLGYTNQFTDVGWAPEFGWSQLGYCEAIDGHTYIVWTADDHYAKVRVTSISRTGALAFQWAWQSVAANFELAPPARPTHSPEWGQPKPGAKTSQLIK